MIDDTAVTPNYVHGFTADRELPIVGRIAWGSIKNKLIFLLPAALLLSFFLPGAITPLLMIGGAYLCYEGAEKIYHAISPHGAEAHEAALEPPVIDPKALEQEKISGAVRTDFILSAEIMTIALAAIEAPDIWTQALILAVVGVGITIAVYGVVALIVKADDAGLWLATHGRTGLGRASGRGIVKGMPIFMHILGLIGTAAMTWVGGSIVAHGLFKFGLDAPEHIIEAAAHWAEHTFPAIAAFAGWLATAMVDFVFGLILGALLIPVASYIIAPALRAIKRLLPKRA